MWDLSNWHYAKSATGCCNIIYQNPFNQIKIVVLKTLLQNITEVKGQIKDHILFGERSAIACYLPTTL
jgi:hypothetical protein